MNRSDLPSILLIMDDDGEESHAVHILAKYHFTNSLLKLRKAADALRHFSQGDGTAALPELIILCLEAPALVSVAAASRKGRMAEVPLILVAGSREVEDSLRQLGLPKSYCIGRPLGFFKLLEAMQKLGLYWVVLRKHPGQPGGAA